MTAKKTIPQSKLNLSLLEKLLKSPESTAKHFVNLLMTRRLNVIKHLAGRENLINIIWRRCVMAFLIKLKSIRKKIFCMLEFHQKNKRTTLLDRLNTLNQETPINTLHMKLLAILLQELILTENGLQPF
jgi:hypothetical protein